MSVNIVVYQGNITKDLDLKYAQSGTAVLSFTIGVTRDFTDKQTGKRESDFITCKAFGKTAEAIANHFQKGSEILVTGRTQTGSYDDQQGQRKYTNDCMVSTFNFTRGSNPNGSNQNSGNQNQHSQQNNQQASNQQQNYQQQSMDGMSNHGFNTQPDPFGNQNSSGSTLDIQDDDLPF